MSPDANNGDVGDPTVNGEISEAADQTLRTRAAEEIGRAVIALIREEPFFGHLLSGINREITEEQTSASITFKSGRPLLRINPSFFVNELPVEGQRSAVIKHEVLHLLLDHPGRFDASHMDAQIYALAANVVVNQLVGEKWPAPPGAVTLDTFDFPLPPDMSVEWYYEELMLHRDEIPDEIAPGHSDNDHWGDSGDEAEDAIGQHELVRSLRDAVDRAGDQFGEVETEIQELVEALVDELKPSVDWRRVIRMFTTSSRRTRIANTLRRPSKRYGTYPGIKVKRIHRLAVVVDTSGSIKEESLGDFFTEVRAIWRQGSQVTVIEADNQVRASWEYRGQVPPKARGRGGTKFDPALQWVAESTPPFDAVLYFTDGKANPPTVRPRCDVLWVLSADGDESALRNQRVVTLSS